MQFKRGVNCYSDRLKKKVLDVQQEKLENRNNWRKKETEIGVLEKKCTFEKLAGEAVNAKLFSCKNKNQLNFPQESITFFFFFLLSLSLCFLVRSEIKWIIIVHYTRDQHLLGCWQSHDFEPSIMGRLWAFQTWVKNFSFNLLQVRSSRILGLWPKPLWTLTGPKKAMTAKKISWNFWTNLILWIMYYWIENIFNYLSLADFFYLFILIFAWMTSITILMTLFMPLQVLFQSKRVVWNWMLRSMCNCQNPW